MFHLLSKGDPLFDLIQNAIIKFNIKIQNKQKDLFPDHKDHLWKIVDNIDYDKERTVLITIKCSCSEMYSFFIEV